MELVRKKVVINESAIELLEELLAQVKQGSITSIGCCYVTDDKDIGGGISEGEDTLLMWTSLIHMERNFYSNFIEDES